MGRIFVTGDTHGSHDIRKLNMKHFPQQNNLTKDDFLIVCGDFGLVWDGTAEEKYWQNWLNEKSFTTLFVDGNHENFNMLNEYPIEIWNGGAVHKISDSIIHLMRGQVFELHGKSFFTMGGGLSIDKNRRIEGKSWWAEEIPSFWEYDSAIENLNTYNWEVDYILTHSAPADIVAKMGFRKKYENSLDKFLETINTDLKFKRWYFGHFHDDILQEPYAMTYWKVLEIK